jgi:hypothetical protein
MKSNKIDGKELLKIVVSSKIKRYAFAECHLPKLQNKRAVGEWMKQNPWLSMRSYTFNSKVQYPFHWVLKVLNKHKQIKGKRRFHANWLLVNISS